jgi:hypothetical protein
MGYPLLLYGLQDVQNYSFEDDVVGVSPSGWELDENYMTAEVQEEAHVTGFYGIGENKSARTRITTPQAYMYVRISQRIAISDLRDVINPYNGQVAVVVMVKFTDPLLEPSVAIDSSQYSGGDGSVGSGAFKGLGLGYRGWITGCGPEWFMLVRVFELYDDAEYLDLRIGNSFSDTTYADLTGYTYFDRVMVGGVIDFPKGVRELQGEGDAGYEINQGDGVFEIVRVRNASSTLSMTVANVLEGCDLDAQLQSYFASCAMDGPRKCAFWGDRDRFTVGTRHFSHLIPDPTQMKYQYEPGVSRRTYELRFIAPREWIV